jgi:hypothetical protein
VSYTPPPNDQPYLPGVSWTTSSSSPVAALPTLNAVASTASATQAQCAAENAPLPIIYGRVYTGALVADWLVYQNDLIMVLVWGEGEINAIETITESDNALPAGITITNYNGTAGQTADATLIAAYASHGITYADALPGIAYTVARIKAGATSGFPTFKAIIQGLKVYDPRTGLTAYSDNPALALADFLTSTVYGMGKTVDPASLTAAANFCDELCGTEKRRVIGLVLDQTNPCTQWIEALRTYAGCFVSQEGSNYRLIPDNPGTSVFSFTASNIVANSLKLKKRGLQQIPTVIDLRYTDTSVLPWAEKSAFAKASGVDAGTTPRRDSQVSLPGITRYSQAVREAIERLNKLALSDLSADFTAFDEALKLQVGDIVDITHPIGLSAKLMRVMSAKIADAGRWQISALEYDPAAYSDVVSSSPTYADTTLPDPAAPPAITGIVSVEEVYQLENGTYSSRIKTTWDAVTYPYLASYRIEVYQAGALIDTASTLSPIYRTAAVKEGVEYVVKVAAITTIGSVGAWAQANITPLGKYLIPGNVPSVAAFEAGGRVYASWEPAVDIDIWRYEVRYGAVGVAWASTLLIDRVDALRLTSDQIPVGTWTIHVKALDSVGQYSATAATVNVTVTSDAAAFLVASYDQTNPTLTNMASYTINPTDRNSYAVTEDGVLAATKFPNTASTYGNIAATYHNSVTSTWLGEVEDFGLVLGGQWTGTATVADISGSHISYIGNSTDNSTWNYPAGLSQKLNARFSRMKHESLTTSTLKVTMPTQNIRVDAVPREEVGTGTSSASGPVTITLANQYVAVKKITITPQGTTARSATYDNIIIGGGAGATTFDVYVFDQSGARIASPFRYEWQGV